IDPTGGLVLIYSVDTEGVPSAFVCADPISTIGRDTENHLQLKGTSVSRRHSAIERRHDGYWISDRGSTNGTLVNGECVETKKLENQDIIRIGDILFRFAASGIYGYLGPRSDASGPLPLSPDKDSPSVLVGGAQVRALLDSVEKVACTSLPI